jgi:exosortase
MGTECAHDRRADDTISFLQRDSTAISLHSEDRLDSLPETHMNSAQRIGLQEPRDCSIPGACLAAEQPSDLLSRMRLRTVGTYAGASPVARELLSLVCAAAVLVLVFLWTFWTTFANLIDTWNRDADYSHGWFVIPVAAYSLWQRRAAFPGWSQRLSWEGFVLLGASSATDIGGSLWYLEPVRAWAIPLWIAGVVWFLGGRQVLRWCIPSILFLAFMIPLPYRGEVLFSSPLQRVATQLSCWILQCLGQPAIAEGNVIVIDRVHLSVIEACSGLRVFMSIIALTFAFIMVTRKPRWMQISLCLSALPIALIVNAARIALTGLLNVYVSGDTAHRISHDAAGWLMILFAAVLLASMLYFLERLVVEVETVSVRELLLNSSQLAD